MSKYKRNGVTWETTASFDDLRIGTIDDKFSLKVWQFGSGYQCVVMIKSALYKEGKLLREGGGIGLPLSKNRTEAMNRGVEWVTKYKKKGAPKPTEILRVQKKLFPDLYPNDIAQLEHLFFVLGNGYEWIDGSLMDRNQEDPKLIKKNLNLHNKEMKKLDKFLSKMEKLTGKSHVKSDTELVREQRWSHDCYCFHSVYDTCIINEVPDNVTPEWLELAYRAAILLRDKSGCPVYDGVGRYHSASDERDQQKNIRTGKRIVKELEKRFPQLKS